MWIISILFIQFEEKEISIMVVLGMAGRDSIKQRSVLKDSKMETEQ